MNEQLQNALADLLTKANNGIEAGADFLTAELPDVIQQLLMWYGVYNGIKFLAGSAALIILMVIWIKYSGRGKLINKDNDYRQGNSRITFTHDRDGNLSPHIMVTGLLSFMVMLFSLDAINLTWLKIWIAPKIWLIEYAATLAK